MKEDAARKNIEKFLKEKNISKREASLFMGQNEAYLHQFFSKGSPLNLPEYPRKKLAELLQVDEQLLTNIPLNSIRKDNSQLASIKEIDVYGGCGSAAEAMVTNTTDKYGNTITADAVRQSWLVPYEYLNEIRCTPEDTRIIEALGDSMVPTIFSGDKVIVDVSSKGKIPSPPGIFVIWDGMGVAIKRIEYIPNSDPPAIRVISDNPNHPPFERTCGECQIIGRVIGLIKRI